MRLAFVTSLLPTGRPDTGFEIATAGVIAALRAAGCGVTMFGVLRPGDEPASDPPAVVLDRMVIENAAAGPGLKARWLLSSLARGLPVIAAKIAPLGAKLMAEIERAGPFDACVVNNAPVAAAYPSLMQRWPCLLVAHNVEHASARENARTAAGATAMLYTREAKLLERAERSAMRAARHVFFLADEDRRAFESETEGKASVFPLLIGDPQAAAPAPVDPIHDVGLIGTWTWQPNLIGLQWFLKEIAPRLPSDIVVAVAGRLPSDVSTNLPNVRLLGRVPDAAAFVAGCRIMALASRTGTGIQLKTIETFQTGKPAVATRSSVRGFDQLPTNCLVAEEPDKFAAAIVKLVNDVKSERTSAGDGRLFVSRQRDGMKQAVERALAALRAGR
jgi:hypothetical protein